MFGKDIPKPTKKQANWKKEKEKNPKFKKAFQTEVAEQLDKHNRPEQKVCNCIENHI